MGKYLRNPWKIKVYVFVCLFIAQVGSAQTEADLHSSNDTILFTPDFFDQDEPLPLTLKFDVKTLMAEKFKEEYLPANLIYTTRDSIQIEKSVRVRARGISRQRYCHLPPFWLNIKGSNMNDEYLLDSKKIKIVTLCRNSSAYNRYLLKEYLTYKLYNILTENSFRARMLEITYINTGRKNKANTSWAFMIEPEDMLSTRIEALPIRADNLNYRHTDSLAADIMCFFQYMIGNTDFTVNGRHNVKLMKYKDFRKPLLIPIPYDFDYSGIVNAEYASPAEVLDFESVTQRYFLGMCRSDEEYQRVMNLFEEKKDEMYAYIESFEYLDKYSRKEVLKYLDEFYSEMKNPNFIKKRLRTTCR